MTIEISDDIIRQTRLTAEQLLLELAVHLYKSGKITVGQGGELTGIGYIAFQRELGKRNITLHYNKPDWEQDNQTLKRLGLL